MTNKNKLRSSNEQRILDSWHKNIEPWVKAVQLKEVESRTLITDESIVNAVLSLSPKSVIDIGCGEGWLVRKLSSKGISATGIEAIEGLVRAAMQSGQGEYKVMKYEDLNSKAINRKYDVMVCNFSLLGKESVEHLFKVATELLTEEGHFVIQTLHPHFSYNSSSYENSWREGNWDGFNDEFIDPAPWYFRTLEAWSQLYSDNGFCITKVIEPINPVTTVPASIIFDGRVAR